jgi:tRNA A-37 threonylcarbamoyl transferase component Bud32
MSRKFIIVDPEDEVQLMLSQYLSMGWHDADIEEETLSNIINEPSLVADAILIGGIDTNDAAIKKILERSSNGELPPAIVLSADDVSADSDNNILPLEDLTPVLLNGAIAEAIKRHADGLPGHSGSTAKASREDARPDNELPAESIKGLRGYRLIRELGRGGMSRVYLAEDNDTGKEVAIKVLDMDTIEDDRMIERFIREYSMLSSIDNIHVAGILDQTFTDEYAFIIMERFQGGDLTRRIRKGVTPKQAINYLKQIADGLKDVHKEGIVHRDLKPGNILFRLDETLAILDFGLAQIDDDSMELTKHGEVYGTPSYVSPEQARGKRIDHRSDIYSVGIIFYQMLTRKKPYRADNPMAMFYKHVHAEVPRLPGEFTKYQPLLDSMLAKSADDRFQNADELIEALNEYQ